ncbi:MAG: hypothetical protein QNK23_15840 [Crocinitomicaceae bacterium]|nr:hypothetical protein [Crocinitomicaceae bacterium]
MKLWIKISLWSIFFIGLIVLGVYINDSLKQQEVPKPEIIVHVNGENAFITSDEFLDRLWNERLIYEGQIREDLDIEAIEAFILGISQVKEAEVFRKIDGSWKVDVTLRNPIARIYNLAGENFYLDDEGFVVETIPSHTARVLVVTGEIDDRISSISVPEIINNDSLISIRNLDDIYRISNYVCKDPLFRSLIGQLHLKKNGDFVLIPLVGDQKIIFGSARSDEDVEEKFKKLKIFYEEAMPYEGWDAYTEISLKFKDQVVCKKKETNE